MTGSLRFKLWAIVGNNQSRKVRIIRYLQARGWTPVDIAAELQGCAAVFEQSQEAAHDIGQKIKEIFLAKPDKLILTNGSLLYQKTFHKITPIGAFKYNISRSKQCILFLEDEQLMSNRLYYGKVGTEEYVDQPVDDILLTAMEQIQELEEGEIAVRDEFALYDSDRLAPDAIGRLFQYTTIKDVIDIDADLKEQGRQRELVASFIISERLQSQILDFFGNLERPLHKAVKIIGNYGSGKSHLIAFLYSVINSPQLREAIVNEQVKEAARKLQRHYMSVQFELMPGTVELATWFYREIEKQLQSKYGIEVPPVGKEDFNHKDNISAIIECVKSHDPSAGLLVIMDEVSDFLAQKESYLINRDFQFLRVVAQVCQDQDMMLVTSMQEDIYTSPKFKDIAAQEARISERFQNIIIHKEAVKQVIAQRIVPKTANQRAELEAKLKPFVEKIEDVAHHREEYISLFPLTPTLLTLFHELPFFEKRGVIQFAQNELKSVLNKAFPFFFTFERVYDLLENDPNKKNLEEIYDVVRVVNLIIQKIRINIEEKLQPDAMQLVKGLAVYSLWSRGQNGATAKELAEQLLIIPSNRVFTATDHVSRILDKIRQATDGFYLKVVKEESTGNHYFMFDPATDGQDPEERIDHEMNKISQDQVEQELFAQIQEILGLSKYHHLPEVFEDECTWSSVKSFRKGAILFVKKGLNFDDVAPNVAPASSPGQRDWNYVVAIISPFRKNPVPTFCDVQINIRIDLSHQENVEFLKQIAAVRRLIEQKIQTGVMRRKLTQLSEGYLLQGTPQRGVKYRLARWFYARSDVTFNGEPVSVQSVLAREIDNLEEILSTLKQRILDVPFTQKYPQHPKYSLLLSSVNITGSLNAIAEEIVGGNFGKLPQRSREFLKSLNLLDYNNDPDVSHCPLAQQMLSMIVAKQGKVTDIEAELVATFAQPPYGVEPQVLHLILVLLTTLGKIALKAKGGKNIDIRNIREEFKHLSQFENINYAVKTEALSYDFASRLLNALGLNGAMMLQEKMRNDAFKAYKERVQEILRDVQAVKRLIEKISRRTGNALGLDALNEYAAKTQVIDWAMLDIPGHVKFSSLEHLNQRLPEIKSALDQLENLEDALEFYDATVYDGLDYMRLALDMLKENHEYLTDQKLADKLQELYADSMQIVKVFSKFITLSERKPLKGKIQMFKDLFIKEFYYPAHERTVGQKVHWEDLLRINTHPLYQQVDLLAKLDCVADSKFRKHLREWESLFSLRCQQVDVEKLEKIPFCTNCNFMRVERDYGAITRATSSYEHILEELQAEYLSTALDEISKHIEQLDLLTLPEAQKDRILQIFDSRQFPEQLDNALIQAINQLFKHIEVVELESEEVLHKLFKPEGFMTFKEFQKALLNLEQEILGNRKEEEIRITLK